MGVRVFGGGCGWGVLGGGFGAGFWFGRAGGGLVFGRVLRAWGRHYRSSVGPCLANGMHIRPKVAPTAADTVDSPDRSAGIRIPPADVSCLFHHSCRQEPPGRQRPATAGT
ncbi:hypothetical protein EGJ24_13360 [Stenotrophomonas maltophilia]|nr:hypothetical protein EGJ24_13360 [Stenotrophomonas maltophilia]